MEFQAKKIVFGSVAGAWLLLGGCALQSDVRILESRLIALERKNSDLQRDLSETRQSKDVLERQLRQYGSLIEEKDTSLRDRSAGLQVTADQLRREIQTLNGRMEETVFRFDQRITALERTMRAAPASGPASGPADGPVAGMGGVVGSPGPVRPPSGSAAEPPPPSGASSDALYARGKQAFDARDYPTAARNFEALLQRFPDAPLAGNAQFWLGEIFYQNREFEQAILAYQQVIETYADGNKVAASLLKQGFAFSNLGDNDNARLILRELIDRFPHGSEARIARQKLDNL